MGYVNSNDRGERKDSARGKGGGREKEGREGGRGIGLHSRD